MFADAPFVPAESDHPANHIMLRNVRKPGRIPSTLTMPVQVHEVATPLAGIGERVAGHQFIGMYPGGQGFDAL